MFFACWGYTLEVMEGGRGRGVKPGLKMDEQAFIQVTWEHWLSSSPIF